MVFPFRHYYGEICGTVKLTAKFLKKSFGTQKYARLEAIQPGA